MSDAKNGAKRVNRRRMFVLDDPSQSTSILSVLGILGLSAFFGAAATYLLTRPNVLGRSLVADSATPLIATVIGCFVVAGLIAVPVMMRLTHRYTGPAYVMRRALRGMRLGDYGCRLTLRKGDFLKPLAKEIDTQRSHIAKRDVERARLLHRMRQMLDVGDIEGARLHLDRMVRAEGTSDVARRSA